MCCILYIPAGVNSPSCQLLKDISLKNRHGIGYATPDGTTCKCTFEQFDKFYKLFKLRNAYEPCIIHFRNATKGGITDTNCQPFYDPQSGVWFAHNGTLRNIQTDGILSDSEIFFYEKFVPAINKYGWENIKTWEFVQNNIERSRMVFMNSKCEVKMFAGDPSFRDWTKSNGIYYSRTYNDINYNRTGIDY